MDHWLHRSISHSSLSWVRTFVLGSKRGLLQQFVTNHTCLAVVNTQRVSKFNETRMRYYKQKFTVFLLLFGWTVNQRLLIQGLRFNCHGPRKEDREIKVAKNPTMEKKTKVYLTRIRQKDIHKDTSAQRHKCTKHKEIKNFLHFPFSLSYVLFVNTQKAFHVRLLRGRRYKIWFTKKCPRKPRT